MEGAINSGDKDAGVIPRSVHTIFEELTKQRLEHSVKVSFLELYNEELSDLLSEEENPGGEHKELRIFEDSTGKRGMLVNNLEEIIVTNPSDVFSLMQKSWQKRRVAETLLNKNSSRSHCVFTITVHTKETNEEGEDIIKTGKLYLVDLAGSECVGKSGAQNQRAKEAGKINQSLLTLGRVINALVDRAGYVPYRDSKLTRLLQESLGGRAKTVIIATVSPSIQAFDETLSTLEYAHRAKNIRNRPQVNQKMTKRAYMKELLEEITALKRENEALRLKNGIYLPPERWEQLQVETKADKEKIIEISAQIKVKEEEFKLITELNGQISTKLADTEANLALTSHNLAQTQQNLAETSEKLGQTQETLAETRSELATTHEILSETKNSLEITQNKLNFTEISLETTQSQLRATEFTLESTEISLGNTKNELEATKVTLGATEGQLLATEKALDLTKLELSEIQLELAEFDGELAREASQHIDSVQNQLSFVQNQTTAQRENFVHQQSTELQQFVAAQQARLQAFDTEMHETFKGFLSQQQEGAKLFQSQQISKRKQFFSVQTSKFQRLLTEFTSLSSSKNIPPVQFTTITVPAEQNCCESGPPSPEISMSDSENVNPNVAAAVHAAPAKSATIAAAVKSRSRLRTPSNYGLEAVTSVNTQ
jgi:hypothetical protein